MDHDQRLTSAIADTMAHRHYGKYRGQVVSNNDSEGLGRLQVVVPAMLNQAQVWAMPCVPYAGDGVGFFAMPPVGSAVWVEFEGGDLDYPIWTGCFWRDSQRPPEDNRDPSVKLFKTDRVTVRIDDGAGEIVIETEGGTRLTLSATEFKAESTTLSHESVSAKTTLSAAGFDVNDSAFTVI